MTPYDIEQSSLTKNRRLVILSQLGVLSFILIGLFGSYFFSGANPKQEVRNIEDVAVTRTLPEISTLQNVEVRAKAAFVYDIQTGTVLYSKNSETVLPLASITKLMTSLLTYELAAQTDTAYVNKQALLQDGSSGFAEGEKLNIKMLQRIALISSSNDAAYAMAATVGATLGDKDPAAQFVAGMNIRAQELGLTTLEFKNPTGLDISVSEPGATGSAEDVSMLMAYIIEEYPNLVEPTQNSVARVYNDSGEFHDIENTNDYIRSIPNLIASKTGYTDLAGGNLTIAFDAAFDRPVIVTVLGSTREERFSDTLRLVKAARLVINN